MIVYRPPARHPDTAVKVVLLSGLSDPATCALYPGQRDFLASLRVPEAWKVYWNFPYVPCAAAERPAPPLWLASWRNVRQFLLAPGHDYRRAARRHWQALAGSAGEIVAITLSCGLEILNVCLAAGESGARVRVVALGPVAREPPRVPATLVWGARDYLARWFFRRADVVLPGVGHMDYLDHPRVAELVNAELCGNTSTSSGPASTCRGAS